MYTFACFRLSTIAELDKKAEIFSLPCTSQQGSFKELDLRTQLISQPYSCQQDLLQTIQINMETEERVSTIKNEIMSE